MERKVATVLFADLVASTELGEQDPERTRRLLEQFYEAMADEVELAGGTLEKFAGDAVMAAFGVPTALEDHPERALHAALAMRRRVGEEFAGRLELRIGVNTGEVVAGAPREGSSFVTGDAVNVCARLEQAASAGEILAGERTVTAARGAFEFAMPQQIEAKGRRQPVRCRRVERALTLMRPRGAEGLRRAFVGREEDVAALQAAYAQVGERGSSHLVTILGEPGVGKTRLVREYWDWLGEQSPQPARRTGRCLSYGRGTTYWPIGEIVREHFAIAEHEPAEQVLSKLRGREILALTLGLDAAAGVHPLVARERLHEAWAELLAELAASRTAVVLVEDLHWAEQELLDLLESTLDRVDRPLLLVCTARPELLDLRPGWGGVRRPASTFELAPLSGELAERMLTSLLDTDLPVELRAPLVARAEGNPYFIEELLATLIDRGAIARDNGAWRVTEQAASLDVPDSVQAVVAARIDLLPHDEKAALQAAAVIGREFWTGPVYELRPEIRPDIRILVERDFVRRRPGSSIPGETEYVFKHQLTREVAYASLPKTERARLHAAFAEWLERFGGGRDEHAPLLAYHYGEAVRPEDLDLVWGDEGAAEATRLRGLAVAWLRRAATLAATRYEVDDAVALLEQALALGPGRAERIGILNEIARAHVIDYDVIGLRASLEQALELEPDPEVAAEVYATLALYGRGRLYMWTNPPPVEVGDAWLRKALEVAQPGTRARALALLAQTLASPQGRAGDVEEALAIAERLDDLQLLKTTIEAHSLVATAEGRYAEAAEWTDRVLQALGARKDEMPGAEHFFGSFAYARAGRIQLAAEHVERHDEVTTNTTAHDAVHAAGLRAVILGVNGAWDELAALADRARRAAAANEQTPCMFNWRTLLMCALGREHVGDRRDAERLEEEARTIAQVGGPVEREPALLRLALLRRDLGEIERILGVLPRLPDRWDVDTPAARLDALIALGDHSRVEEEAGPLSERPSYYRPFALRALGVVRSDRSLIERAAAEFADMGLDWRAAETGALL